MKLTAKRLKQIIREVMEESNAHFTNINRDMQSQHMQSQHANNPTKPMPSNPADKIVNNLIDHIQNLNAQIKAERDPDKKNDLIQQLVDLQGSMGMGYGQ